MWLNQNVLLPDEIEGKDAELDMMFLSLRTGNPLAIKMDPSGNVSIVMVQFHVWFVSCSFTRCGPRKYPYPPPRGGDRGEVRIFPGTADIRTA